MSTPAETGPSWDERDELAPDRPEFASNLPPANLIARPRRTVVALVFTLVSALCFFVFMFTASGHLDEMRATLIDALPQDLREDYDAADIDTAANVMIGVVAAATCLLVLIQVAAVNAVVRRRRSGGRVIFLIAGILYLAGSVIALGIRDGGTTDFVLIVTTAALICVTFLLLFSTRVTRWLKQNETPRYVPLVRNQPEPES